MVGAWVFTPVYLFTALRPMQVSKPAPLYICIMVAITSHFLGMGVAVL